MTDDPILVRLLIVLMGMNLTACTDGLMFWAWAVFTVLWAVSLVAAIGRSSR